MIEYKNLDVEYDQIVILDLLSDTERTKWRITTELNTLLTGEKFSTKIINLTNKKELLDALQNLTTEAKSGKRFMLHFVGHGNENCIGFKHTMELISWSELEEPLRILHTATDHTLILNMTTCKGLNVIKAVDHLKEELPFFGIIGYTGDLGFDLVIVANKIFYLSMADGNPIQRVIEEVKKKTSDDNFHCITAQGFAAIKNKIEPQN
jgi:hypothetical protein